ncbi:MAG: tRNA pseudouridine(13) synthase TruD, partial [Candidatus Bathyarchaeia archaeon]
MLFNLCYLSKSEGTGGKIRKNPWDFIVTEIDLNGEKYYIDKKVGPKWTKKEDYVVFVLQKRNWTTIQALREITKRLSFGKKRISCAGAKDRKATTVQLASIFRTEPERIMKIEIKDINILGAWYWDVPVKMGDLLGNAFEIKVPSVEEDCTTVNRIYEELNGVFPNYFGEQRFGIEKNNHIIGKYILKGEFEEAVIEYITKEKRKQNDKCINEIETDMRNHNFGKVLEKIPKYLKYERTILNHLLYKRNDYVGALRKLPRSVLLMFVHSVQSYLFNILLHQKLEEAEPRNKINIEEGEYLCGKNWYGFPEINRIDGTFPVGKLIGYSSKPNKREKEILDIEGLSVENFKIKSIPEI